MKYVLSILVTTVFSLSTVWACGLQSASGGTQSAAANRGLVTAAYAGEKKVEQGDIVEMAVGAGSFNTLVTAVQAAGLVETLKGKGPFTVFAPTDEAFAKIPKETLDGLLKDKTALGSVLTYHVVAGRVMAADVAKMNGEKVTTFNGQELSISVKDGKVMVDNAAVVTTDIKCTNGVIHVIDSVVLPR